MQTQRAQLLRNLLRSFVINASHWLGPWLAGPDDESASTETSSLLLATWLGYHATMRVWHP
eukprot:2031880-Prorocentrum_lima.AAC.1